MATRRNAADRRKRRARLFEVQGGICFWCKRALSTDRPTAKNYATFDELVPRAKGGTQHWKNIVLSCQPCNNRRGCADAPHWAFALVAQRIEPWISNPQVAGSSPAERANLTEERT